MTLIIDSGYTWDADATAYIEAVEAADTAAGQSGGLEESTRKAIENFVVGCKADGIWNAIKASCILSGARTLSGALVPLAGTTPPTNFNFVSGDYNRKTGLVGNGSTKYLNSNRNNNADPQNSKHLSLYISSQPSSLDHRMMGSADPGVNGYSILTQVTSTNVIYIGLNRTSGFTPTSIGATVIGFFGAVRSSPTIETARALGQNYDRSISSTSPSSATITVYQADAFYSPARLAFYSIGESIDLALLDARVTTLINSFATSIP